MTAVSQLFIYNKTLGYLGERRISTLTEAREPRRVLDDYWADVTSYCLERKLWNFSYRTVSIDSSTTIIPGFGFLYAFNIPNDWIRTRRISSVTTMDPPLLQMAEEAGFWYTNITPIYVEYNSSDPLYGMNLGAWPQSFADYVALRLAQHACYRITGSDARLAGPEGLLKREEKAYKVAAANCAMNEAVGFAPQSSWVRARRGMVRGLPSPGGDEPTGGGLIP